MSRPYRRDRSRGWLREADLEEMARAWRTWARSPDGFMAFAWCRALGRKPRR